MTGASSVSAPIADWVSIPDLYADPFPTYERMRSEGGVHWVPAVNRYLITSYEAVHHTELDQNVYSADEEGSLMIRAMGHSMLRRDDPVHHVERKAWQPVLRPGVVKKTWTALFERNAEKYLAEFIAKGPGADLVWDFAAPYSAENLRQIIGLHNSTPEDLQRWSQTMIDATGNYADDPEIWARGQASYDEVDAALDEMLVWHSKNPDDSLLSALLRVPDYQMPIEAIRANVKMTIGGGLNEPRDAMGVATWALLEHPQQRELALADPANWNRAFDEAIRWVAPIGMYSRQTTQPTTLTGVDLPEGAKLGICILSANRDEKVWKDPEVFDLRRTEGGAHLAFGKGVHVCLGAWVARAEVATVAMPLVFERLAGLAVHPDSFAELGGWVFRGMTRLPVTWNAARSSAPPPPPTSTAALPASARIAVVGSGPAGCYCAHALRKAYPASEIAVFDSLPVPYGLVRSGVAADHQGTKAVAAQFARLFERDGVTFVGNTKIGDDISLARLREAFDIVVLANGLHADATLGIPGDQLPGVHGAGRITRLLNAHVHEPRPVPELGAEVAVIGHGNVAMDLIRLLAKEPDALRDSDIDDEAHETLTKNVRVIHAIGRSLPADAKFDPVMLREILGLRGVEHVVHGVLPSNVDTIDTDDIDDTDDAVATDKTDPRSTLVRELAEHRAEPRPRVRIEWWFGYRPERIDGTDHVRSLDLVESRAGDAAPSGSTVHLEVSDVITAIGFAAEEGNVLSAVDNRAASTGRIEPGLYVAGWARRGPRGTIPSQRADARELVETIKADGLVPCRPGLTSLSESLARSTDYAGWLLIDAEERRQARAGRLRSKIRDHARLLDLAGAAGARRASASAGNGATIQRDRPRVDIWFGTESGNAELVAEDIAQHLSASHDVSVRDLGTLSVADIDTDIPVLVICSTYGDGELPTSVRRFETELTEQSPDLAALRYSILGLGDRSYHDTYSRGSEVLDKGLAAHGAERVGRYGRHDAASGEAASATALDWVDELPLPGRKTTNRPEREEVRNYV